MSFAFSMAGLLFCIAAVVASFCHRTASIALLFVCIGMMFITISRTVP